MQNGYQAVPFDEALQSEAAFGDFFKAHFKDLCAFCLFRFKVDTDQAKELVHTAFIKLWEARNTLTPGHSPKAYLIRIITNNAIDFQRHQQVKRIYERYVRNTTSEMAAGEEAFDLRQLMSDIDKAVAGLPQQMRTIYQLSRHHGLKYREIAEQLKLSEKTVETQMSRAMIKLRHQLAHHLPACVVFFL